MQKTRSYSRYTWQAVSLLGKQIRLQRKHNKWTEGELAQRVGVSRATIQKIEKGDLSCQIGLVLEAATLVGLKLLQDAEQMGSTELPHPYRDLTEKKKFTEQQLSVLPKAIRKKKVDDDF